MQKRTSEEMTTPRGRGGRPKKLKPTGGAGSPPAAAAAAEGLHQALANDPLITPLNSIKHQPSGTAEPCEVDPDYPGTAFKRSIPHGPPDPIKDAFGRISSSDAIRIASTYCTSWPNFITVMKATSNKGLYVPSQFGTHLPKRTHQLKLHNREKGKSWTIKVAYENKRKMHTFCGGWPKFMGDNELKYGDVCIFELLGKHEVSVLILKVRDPSEAYINEVTPLRIINQADSEGAADSEYRGTGSHFKNPVKHIPPISVNWPIEDEAGRISASDAYRILFSYVTPWPHFIHFKKDSEDFNFVAMRVPDHFGRHIPNGKHQLKFHNKGKIWSITSTSNQQKKAHYLTSGWQEFIDENEIRSGDICICELVGECEVKVLMLKVRDPSHTYINKVVSYLKDGGSTSDL